MELKYIDYGYNKSNYWKIPPEDLPSLGVFYNPDYEIKIRPLQVREMKYLATFSPINATLIINEILSKCMILKNIEFNEILLADREYLIFWLRCNSLALSSGYKITIQECPICKNGFDYEIKLDKFETRYIKRKLDSIYLEDMHITLPIAQPTITSQLPNVKLDDDIKEIAMYLDTNNTFEEKVAFISKLTAYDFSNLKYTLEDFMCGMNKIINVECPTCNNVSQVLLPFNDADMFSCTKLPDILELITRVAKYTSMTITDDWPWIEVEIEQQIVNKMIKEENDQNQKEMAKAKAKANAAMSSTHVPRAPSVPHMNYH